MNTRMCVENLPAGTSVADLTGLFSAYGQVVDVNLTVDQSGQPQGFVFVTMATAECARAAILGLHRKQLAARTLIVTETRLPGPGLAGAQPLSKPARQTHHLLAELKKNRIIPTISSPEDGRAG